MRQPKYMSPTSLGLFYQDREEYYKRYMADNKKPQMKQTEPMLKGQQFDCRVKEYLRDKLGLILPPDLELVPGGEEIFDLYAKSGALADLVIEMERDGKIMVEGTVQGVVLGVPVLGKPDIVYGDTIIDHKVNGWCSASRLSPKKYYIKHRQEGKCTQHKNCDPTLYGKVWGTSHPFHEIDISWATQLWMYSRVLDREINTVGIEQICGQDRVVSYRGKFSADWVAEQEAKLVKAWEIIQSGHIFDALSVAESKERTDMMDQLRWDDTEFNSLLGM